MFTYFFLNMTVRRKIERSIVVMDDRMHAETQNLARLAICTLRNH